jgi:DNA polymerase III delta prime subunit
MNLQNNNILNSLWVEKYRPKTLDEMVLSNENREIFQVMIEKKEIPNLLFFGLPGGGKSTVARIIYSTNGVMKKPSENVLKINGSAQRTRKIGYVEDTIEPFLNNPPIYKDRYRIVFIDEFDHMTSAAHNSLRGIIEKYQEGYGRFIVTGNDLYTLSDALQSRFEPYYFEQVSTEFVFNYCERILKSENIQYDEKTVKMIIDELYPDIRQIVQILNKKSRTGKLKVIKSSIQTEENKLIMNIVEIISAIKSKKKIQNSNMNNIELILKSQQINYKRLYNDLYFHPNMPVPAKIIINEHSLQHRNAITPEMNFMAMCYKIIQSLLEFQKKIK